MTLTTPMVITYDYVCTAVNCAMFATLSFLAFYYSLTGKERIAGISKAGLLVFIAAALAGLFDAGADPFFYIRPTDGVKVYWFRQTISVFIMPLLFIGFFELLHNPHESVDGEYTQSKYHKKGNIQYIYCLTKWAVFFLSLASESLILPATLSDNSSVRWAAFAIGLFGGLVAFCFVYAYIRIHGMRMGHKDRTMIKHYFYGKKANAILALVAWVLIMLYWAAREFLLGFGYALGYYFTYDNEVTGYLSIQLVLVIAVICACIAATKIHVLSEKKSVVVVLPNMDYQKA